MFNLNRWRSAPEPLEPAVDVEVVPVTTGSSP